MFIFDPGSALKWTHIVIHNSLTKDQLVVDWKAISRYHRVERHWTYIGYHWGVEWVKDHYEFCVGRPLNYPGAHTKEQNMNYKAIGICLIGNFDIAPPDHAQYWYLASICRDFMRDFNIPIENIHPHNQYAPYKTCPGKLFSMDELKRIITGGKKDETKTVTAGVDGVTNNNTTIV